MKNNSREPTKLAYSTWLARVQAMDSSNSIRFARIDVLGHCFDEEAFAKQLLIRSKASNCKIVLNKYGEFQRPVYFLGPSLQILRLAEIAAPLLQEIGNGVKEMKTGYAFPVNNFSRREFASPPDEVLRFYLPPKPVVMIHNTPIASRYTHYCEFYLFYDRYPWDRSVKIEAPRVRKEPRRGLFARLCALLRAVSRYLIKPKRT